MTSNASIVPSDTESNASAFIRYSDKNLKKLFVSMIEDLETVNHSILKLEKNLDNLAKQAGPLEGQLSALLQSLPKPRLNLPMETD